MSKKNNFAVILAGNGVFDGSEIHEAVLTLYSISKNGGEYQIFAPDIEQHHVINHITGEEMPEKRNVLVESSRIARGNIKDLKDFCADDFDALIIPGGFGVAKNLSSFAFDGHDCVVNNQVENAIKEVHKQGKPIGALCIAPAVIAKVLDNVKVTIGSDEATANALTKLGANHVNTNHGEIVFDEKNNVVTTPCYMLDATISQIGEGAENVVKKIIELIA